jgi:endoglucanase
MTLPMPHIPLPTTAWRQFTAGWLLTLLLALLAAPAQAQTLKGWDEWKATYMQADGRVLDTGQKSISHSEGQGFAMVLATAANDRAAFDTLWTWTQNNLGSARNDGLFAWRWEPGRGVTDTNTATDGDLFIAWGLARAAEQWKQPLHREQAARIAKAVREKSVVDGTPWGTMLKPGVIGFDTPRGLIVNPSYWVFPAFDALNKVDPDPHWAALTKSGLRLIEIARFSRWALTPDWLLLVNPLELSPNHAPRYGLDAVRVPMYLTWAKLADATHLAPFQKFWTQFRCDTFLPAWANLQDHSIDSLGAEPGLMAIRNLATTGKTPANRPTMSTQSYYSATLGLLADVAAKEGGRK